MLQEFQTKNLSFATSLSSGDSSSFSRNKNKLPIPSMIEKWHMDAKLEERNGLLKALSTKKAPGNNHEEDAYRPASLSSTADILRERAWRVRHDKPIYDPILLNKQAPSIFTETILKPHVQKLWQQSGNGTSQNAPFPPKFNKKTQQVQKALFRLICEAIESFETQLLQGVREESMRSSSTGKKRKGSHHGNKRPKIAVTQADSDDSSSMSMVRVTFSGVSLKLHRAYLEKLQRLYDRTRERQRRTDSGCLPSSYFHLSFEEALFCLLCRYDMIQGAGLQAGVPGAIMDVLLERFGCRMECFASPFNCRYDCFASAFADVDAPFGSRGSFFELPFSSDDDRDGSSTDSDGSKGDDNPSASVAAEGGICYEANPPFCDGLILQLDEKITEILSLKGSQPPIMFVVFVPAWRDSECYQALLANPCLTKHLLLKQGEHWYAEGTQHRRKDSFRVASFDTSILFYQNGPAKQLWNVQGEDNSVFRELRSAFGQNPGTMQKEQDALEKRSNSVKETSSSANFTRATDTSAATCKSSPVDDLNNRARSISSTKTKGKMAKAKKATKEEKRQWNQKEEGKAQLALLESLGLSSSTAVKGETSDTPKSNISEKVMRKKKKRRKK